MPARLYPHHLRIETDCIWTAVGDAPVGLLLLESGEIICKSEYKRNDGQCECIIVGSGEYYWGEGDNGMCVPFELNYPEDAHLP